MTLEDVKVGMTVALRNNYGLSIRAEKVVKVTSLHIILSNNCKFSKRTGYDIHRGRFDSASIEVLTPELFDRIQREKNINKFRDTNWKELSSDQLNRIIAITKESLKQPEANNA